MSTESAEISNDTLYLYVADGLNGLTILDIKNL